MNGNLREHYPPKGFSIIEYYYNTAFFSDKPKTTMYQKFFGINKLGGEIKKAIDITKEEAQRLIEKNGLKLVVDNIHGKIWE